MSHENLDHEFNISRLLIKALNNSLTVAEEAELNTWLNKHPDNRALYEQMKDDKQRSRDLKLLNSFNADKAFNKLITRINTNEEEQGARVVPMKLYYRIVAAAMVLIISVFGIWYLQKAPDHNQTQLAVVKKNIPENNDKIVLKLASGASVDVEQAGNGVVGRQGKVTISKEDNRMLSLNTGGAAADASAASMNNTLWVPKGKQYQLQLPDGSKVWLNAQSSITFPANFNATERVVELSGEAYFEVAHHNKWPFRVKTAEQVVQVLGTHFNVQAYEEDGKTVTTLVSGSVKVSKGTNNQIIKPGEQALSYAGEQKLQIGQADIDAVLDWKNGMLKFNDEKIEDIMRKVSRTYNVDIEVDDSVKGKHFWGQFPVQKGWLNLLRNLEQTNTIHYKVNGRRVMVMP